MRVATIFTGVAAVTVGTTQIANAEDANHPAAKHIGQTARPAGTTYGSIKDAYNCAWHLSRGTWLHVDTSFVVSDTSGHVYQDQSVCYGFKGFNISPPGVGMHAQCGGNNHGSLIGSEHGERVLAPFGPGTTYRTLQWSHLNYVSIRSWTGNDTCGIAPSWGISHYK
jgi:hypothetical protein